MTVFRKLMVANRGEIAIRVFRSAHELGIRTVAVYSHEDRFALHRLKADEAYQVGKAGEPIHGYLNIPAIVGLAQEKQVDAIHPGYGFLSENAEFARACARAGIVFVGPPPEVLDLLGDKAAARNLAREADVPILAGSDSPVLPGPGAHEVIKLEIEEGKTLIVKLLAVGEPHADGKRTIFFELNGQPREVEVLDRSLASSVRETPKADPSDPDQIGAPLPGLVAGMAVTPGDRVRKGQKLLSIEAMKMETTLYAERPARVAEVIAMVGLQVKAGDLLLKMTSE